jgi:hypothetical protein
MSLKKVEARTVVYPEYDVASAVTSFLASMSDGYSITASVFG